MSQEQPSSQTAGSGLGTTSIVSPASLPDVNAETYPFEYVQFLLDQTADLNIFVIPDPEHPDTATLTPDDPSDYFGLNGGYGISLRCAIHHFDSVIQNPSRDTGLPVTEIVGEAAGTFEARCFFSDDLHWSPGKLPPPAIYDPWRSQRFVMLGTEFSFGSDKVQGYAIGRTFPVNVNGQPELLVGGVGNIVDGFGKLSGLDGTFVLTGKLTPALGFLGNITCRLVDPYGYVNGDRELSTTTEIPNPDPASVFVLLRGEKHDKSVETTYGPPPGGGQVSLITPSQLRAVHCGFSSRGGGGIRTERRFGQVVGNMVADVYFDLLAPPGTAQAPVPFTTNETYQFTNREGQIVGTLTTGVVEGISFKLKFPAAPGQAGVRFAGFGPITGGTGSFEGVQGMLTVNSLIGIAPHALSLLHVLYILDPEERFRHTGGVD